MAEKLKRPHVLEALETVQTELAKVGIAKDMKNQGQGFKFRGIDQVLTTLSGLLAANGVQIAMEVDELRTVETRETKNGGKLYTTLVGAKFTATSLRDGSQHFMGRYFGEGSDSNDKATSKAHSMSYKYAAFLGFCIPLEGVLDDSDADSPAEAPSSPAKASKAPKATKAAPQEDDASEEPAAPAKAKSGNEVQEAVQAVLAAETLKEVEELALGYRSLRAHPEFAQLKNAVKDRMATLKAKEAS